MEFGELVEPDTRAFWENYDEFDDETSQPAPLSWKWMDEDFCDTNKIAKFKNFYILEGHEIFNFIQSTVLKKSIPICQIDGHKTSVYKLTTNSNEYYLCISEDTDLDQAATITDLLLPWLLKAENVFVFTFKSAYSYNTDQKFDKRCFIRTISNNTIIDMGDLEFIASMEDCNIIYGVSAGVSTWREINHLSFNCFAIYTDSIQIDSVVAAPVLKLFTRLGLKCDTSYSFKNVNTSNLYI